MTREERAQELSAIRVSDPVRLIATYRTATKMPLMAQMPRGLGFTGMIEAILQCEFEAAAVAGQPQAIAVAQQFSIGPRKTTVDLHPAAPARRRGPRGEFRAFCDGAALVCMGVLMAALYVLMAQQVLA